MKIEFVDHHLNNYHANKFLSLLHGPLKEMGGIVTVAWESNATGEDWCEKNKIPRANSAMAVAEHVDAVIVLAPDNIDAHLELCKQVFPARKPCLVDKFLAPDLKSAQAIVDLARQHGVKLFSSSSLRFAVELEAAKEKAGGTIAPDEAFARGMGEWDGYGVHTLALLLGAMGPGVKRIINTGSEKSAVVTLDYGGGKRAYAEVRASADQWEASPWSFGWRAGDKYVQSPIKDFDGFYANLMKQTVKFFQTGESPVTTEEMLKIVAILESAEKSRKENGAWINV